VFGFLAWELKENWRLYAANRSATLRPVQVGHHGETMRRLLLPGFHSGTIPKLFARLRRIHARGSRRAGGSIGRVDRQRHELQRDIATFFERDVIGLLERAAACEGLGITVDEVGLAVDRITVALGATDIDRPPLVVELARHADSIESRIVDTGWLDGLPAEAEQPVRLAIAGYHRLAAADEATAAFADLPGAPPAVSEAGEELVPVAPIAWATWREAWERHRADGPGFRA
jgi:hypothetical protein